MARGKVITGITLEENTLKIASVRVNKGKLSLVQVDKIVLVEDLKVKKAEAEPIFDDLDNDFTDDSIFGLDDSLDADTISVEDLDSLDDDSLDLDIGLDELEDQDELVDLDMADETDAIASNELLIYNILSSIDVKRVDLALNIPAGNTVFQILKDVNFSETKRKDLKVIIDDRLESLYGDAKTDDFYSYTVRDDGALLLASIDESPLLINLIDSSQGLYRGKIFISDIVPDEVTLIGLIRANYDWDDDAITGVVQFGEETTRVMFLRGSRLWIVSPMIVEGTRSKKLLSTVFSKILFQLDTGEVPNLDRVILCNNSLGEEAVSFFQERFPDVEVDQLRFNPDLIDTEGFDETSLGPFTTAIGTAWNGSNVRKEDFPGISLIPNYVRERQKIFKLQWHGFMLLVFIFVSPILLNYFIQNNNQSIESLEQTLETATNELRRLDPIVSNYNSVSSQLQQLQGKVDLLNELSGGTLRWSTNLDLINRGIDDVNSIWLLSLSPVGQTSTYELTGVALYKNRIPLVAGIFADATLLDVTTSELRGREIYNFSYTIHKMVDDESVYTPKLVNEDLDLDADPDESEGGI
ncbi:MAG: hypothetical protein AAFW89_13750 [Bacteroidota bacterium]